MAIREERDFGGGKPGDNELSLEDEDILHVLKKEGYEIFSRSLGRIRRDMDLMRRASPFINREESLNLKFWKVAGA